MVSARHRDADAALAHASVSGVFTVSMAIGAGLTPAAVRHRKASGAWTDLPGAGFTASGTATEWQRCVSALLTWPDAVIGVRTAARLHGLPVEDDGDIHLLVRSGRRSNRRLRAYRIPLHREEIQTRGPVRLSSRTRTILDCLGRLPQPEAAQLLTWVRTRELISVAELGRAVVARKGWSGVSQLRELCGNARAGALSEGEKLLHHILDRAGLDGWEADVRITDGAQIIARVDVLFRKQRVVVEFDGKRYHNDFQRERERLNALTLAGYVVLRFTWADVTDRAESVVQEVRRALGGRG